MFSLSEHLIYFTDPLSDTLERGDRIFCNVERVQRNTNLGKIVDVVKFTRYDGRGWRVTEDGYHLSGPVVGNHNTEWNAWHLGLINGMDNVVVLGRFQGTHGGLGSLAAARWSDQRKLPAVVTGVHGLLVDSWFKAASWAFELFPTPEDDDATVTAKLDLAKQRWEHRRAKTTLLLEGANRGYTQLTDLVDEGDLPVPVFGAAFNGDILIPSGRAPERSQRTVATQERLDRISAKLGTVGDPRTQYVSISAEIPLDVRAEGVDGVNKVQQHQVANALRNATDDYDITAGSYSLHPILRSTTNAA